MITPEKRARNRAYYLGHKEKMDAQIKAALEKRLAAGVPREISSFRPYPTKPYIEDSRKYHKNLQLQRNYGLDLAAFQVMYGKQEGLCAICCAVLDQGKGCAVDHCHTTGKVRALLCQSCNRGLGCFGDDIQRLEVALKYLTSHG